MPIINSARIAVCDQETFHWIDRAVTGFAFQIHNDFGRCLDERLYQAALAECLSAHGFKVVRELTLSLSLDSFIKEYAADFLVNDSVIVETKTAETLTPTHTAQVLNYLDMCGLHHGTLLNLRPERVEHQFVSTQSDRRA